MSKVYAEQLPKHLKAGLQPIYLVSGDEPLVVQECCDQIRETAKAAGFLERELFHAEGNFDWNQLYQATQNLSLFAERKLIEIRLTGKLPDAGRKALVEYAQAPAEDLLLLIVAPKMDRKTQTTKWFKSLEKTAQFIPVWPISAGQLPQWIKGRAKRLGLQIDPDALDILCARVEGNLLAAVQELQKLTLLTEDGHINAALMAHAVADSARYDVFTLVDKALHGDARGAVKNLHGLRSEGTEPLAILWILTREIRQLLQISHDLSQGKQFASAAKSQGIWDNRQPLIKGALQRLKPAQLNRLLRKAAHVDQTVKGLRPGDPWPDMLEIVLNLAGVNALSTASEKVALGRTGSR